MTPRETHEVGPCRAHPPLGRNHATPLAISPHTRSWRVSPGHEASDGVRAGVDRRPRTERTPCLDTHSLVWYPRAHPSRHTDPAGGRCTVGAHSCAVTTRRLDMVPQAW